MKKRDTETYYREQLDFAIPKTAPKPIIDNQGVNFYKLGNILGPKRRYPNIRQQAHKIANKAYREKNPFDFPKFLILEPTNYCNLACPFCPRTYNMRRPLGYMDINLYKKIIDEASSFDVYGLSLYALGESLLHQQLPEMIKYAKKKGVPAVNLSTNATLPMEKLLGTDLTEITLCVDGATKETYEKNRVNGRYEKVVKNIQDFLKAKTTGKFKLPFVRLQMILTPDTKPETISFINQWLNTEGVDLVYIRFLEYMTAWIGNRYISSSEQKEMNKKRLACAALWKLLTIFWNGDVALCSSEPHGKLVVGNIKEKPLAQIWHSKTMQEFRRQHLQNDLNPVCSACTEWRQW